MYLQFTKYFQEIYKLQLSALKMMLHINLTAEY